jgi:hypothetical protein
MADVAAMPISAKKIRKRLREVPRSAIAPRTGAARAMATPASELARPSRAVLTAVSTPTLQYCLKKRGKNPAMIVVANAEFAQSYSAQETTPFFSETFTHHLFRSGAYRSAPP